MRLQQYITELFDTKVDIKVEKQTMSADIYTFVIDDIEYSFHARNEKGTWEIAFSQYEGIGITGSGNAPQVFAAISKCLDMFLKKYKPMEFWFSAKEPSRRKLYKRFAKLITRKYRAYDFRMDKAYDGDDVFIFSDKS
jgi:hypothetical protein